MAMPHHGYVKIRVEGCTQSLACFGFGLLGCEARAIRQARLHVKE